MSKNKGIILLTVLLLLCTSIGLAEGVYKNIEVYIGNIATIINHKEVSLDKQPFIYEDRVYVPLRFVAESMGAEVNWDRERRQVSISGIRPLRDFQPSNPIEGEIFVYGLITDIEYEDRKIVIEQHFDDNSMEVTPVLELSDGAIIILQRNDKGMNLEFNDLRIGEDIGMVVDAEGKVRGIIITD